MPGDGWNNSDTGLSGGALRIGTIRAPGGFGRDAENGNRDGRAPRQCPSWWPCASTGQWQFGVDERGKGRLNFCRAKNAKAAKSRSDAMTIAQPFMAGSSVNQIKKSREGRQNNSASSLAGLWTMAWQRVPAMNGWAIFRGSGATAKTATGTGALPGKVPAVRPMAVWGGTYKSFFLRNLQS